MPYHAARSKRSLTAFVALHVAVLLWACELEELEGPSHPSNTTPIANDAQSAWQADAALSFDASTTSEASRLEDGGAQLDAQTPADHEMVVAEDATNDSLEGGPSDGHFDLGKGDGKDVVTIGDSWMQLLFTGIQTNLVKVSGQPYRTYGFPGTRLLNGDIPAQWDRAKRDGADIKTVVMTGGGNDILLGGADDCPSGGLKCQAILDGIGIALPALWQDMSEAGVQDVIHVMYSATALANHPVKNLSALDAHLKLMCAVVPPPMRCHQLNTDALAMDLRIDGIHPNDAGYERIGKAVFDLMTTEGMRR
jgi:hypothetical protein